MGILADTLQQIIDDMRKEDELRQEKTKATIQRCNSLIADLDQFELSGFDLFLEENAESV